MSQPSAADMGETVDSTVLRKGRMEASKLEEKAASSQAKAKDPSLLIPVTLLFSLIPLGIFSMHILMHRNGYYGSMVHLRDFGPHLLPGTKDPLVRKYIGNGFLDYWLTVLVCFFANAVDGSEPELTVLCAVFAGNMGPCLVLVYVESLRKERKWGASWFACFWCLSMQTLSFGLTMPTYCIISLLTSPRLLGSSSPQPQIESSSIGALRVMPWSMTLGYIVPTILMCSRSFSNTIHQYLLAFWQPFPLWVALFQVIFSIGTSGSLPSSHQTDIKALNIPKTSLPRPMLWIGSGSLLKYQSHVTTDGTRIASLRALAYATDFASYCAVSLHWIIIFVLLSSKLIPSVSTLLGIPQLSIIEIFMPANPFLPVQITAMPQGVLAFLQYDFYIGILATLIWTTYRQHELEIFKGSNSHLWVSIWTLCINVICFGPGATVIGYAYLREAELELMAMRRLELTDKSE